MEIFCFLTSRQNKMVDVNNRIFKTPAGAAGPGGMRPQVGLPGNGGMMAPQGMFQYMPIPGANGHPNGMMAMPVAVDPHTLQPVPLQLVYQ